MRTGGWVVVTVTSPTGAAPREFGSALTDTTVTDPHGGCEIVVPLICKLCLTKLIFNLTHNKMIVW